MDLVELVYQVSREFPKEELYGLTNQVRRAVVSIPSNIAEGQSRQSTAEFKRFLSIAQGSRAEVETQIMIAQRLGYLKKEQTTSILNLSEEIKRMIYALTAKLN
ncbi:four helix bundle protein [Geminocystis sp. CENA526]|uniref:four helix bundle protein n=1 Tax=Geminocystis sp. CENA526 TaxID=1355871 RepID=UPI003D6F0AD0